jgi:hypothetical protein
LKVGKIWLDSAFYIRDDEVLPKYFVVLGIDQWDMTYCVLTSQPQRPQETACYHGAPYPAFL